VQNQLLAAIADQTNHKKILESVAKPYLQKFSWFGFERKELYPPAEANPTDLGL
jgi:hypothetical protein